MSKWLWALTFVLGILISFVQGPAGISTAGLPEFWGQLTGRTLVYIAIVAGAFYAFTRVRGRSKRPPP